MIIHAATIKLYNIDYLIQNQVTHSSIGNKTIEELVVISDY